MNNPFLTSNKWQDACIYAWSIGESYTHLHHLFKLMEIPIQSKEAVIKYIESCDDFYDSEMRIDKLHSLLRTEAHVNEWERDQMSHLLPPNDHLQIIDIIDPNRPAIGMGINWICLI